MDDETRTNQDDEPDITNAPVAASDAADDGGDATPDDAAATPLGAAGAVIRALAADDTDNDG